MSKGLVLFILGLFVFTKLSPIFEGSKDLCAKLSIKSHASYVSVTTLFKEHCIKLNFKRPK
jgi:hypothetical protein